MSAERPPNPELTEVVHRNIRALLAVQREFERKKSRQNRIADAITRFVGTMAFAYVHVVLVAFWILFNVGLFGAKPFDPFPFILLAMITAVEAIFLMTFVLITQNRQEAANQRRADLDLQINLLAEHEITRIMKLLDAVAHKLDVEVGDAGHMAELEKDVAPEDVLEEIEREEELGRREEKEGPQPPE